MARIFGHLHNFKDLSIKFRVDKPDYSDYKVDKFDWEYLYREAKEWIPENAPEPKGKEVVTSHFEDSSLYHCKVTGRAVTGIIHMINKTPIEWFSKRQSCVEVSTYGAEFASAKTCVEQVIGIHYDLRMMGIPIGRTRPSP